MVVINHQVEDDNIINGSITNKTPLSASNEEELKLQMIRIYEGMFEDDNNNGSGVSEADKELMIRIYNDTICPMIGADIKRKQQEFVFEIKEKFGLDLSACTTWNLQNMESTSGSQSLQLKFLNGISTPVSAGKIIEGDRKRPFVVALVDGKSGVMVTTGAEAAMEVEIVVLEGDCNDAETDNWTSEEFSKKIIREWKGKNVLKGNRFVKLNEGTVSVDKISFTQNSVWKGNRKCRMGARSMNAGFPTRVKEAKTESFVVRDKRKDLYNKHEIPSLSDPLYRLHKFSRRAVYYETLIKAGIKTVMDLITHHAINPQRLKKILHVCPNQYKIIMDHANMCKDDKGIIYLYRYPSDEEQTSNGVAFNIAGKLSGIIEDCQFVPCNKLPDDKRADAQKLIVSSSEHWKEVVRFNNQDLLIEHLQSLITLNTSSNNNLSVMIPQTTDPHNHTNLTSPKSQSPKRPASEHMISNSSKQPRYDHPQLSDSMTSVRLDTSICPEASKLESIVPDGDDEYLKYLNLPADTWKIVCYVVGWISMISKPRKRRTTFCRDNTVIVIAASIEHAQT